MAFEPSYRSFQVPLSFCVILVSWLNHMKALERSKQRGRIGGKTLFDKSTGNVDWGVLHAPRNLRITSFGTIQHCIVALDEYIGIKQGMTCCGSGVQKRQE